MKKEIISFYNKKMDKLSISNETEYLIAIDATFYYMRENNLHFLSSVWNEEKKCYIIALADYDYVGDVGYVEFYSDSINIKHIKLKQITDNNIAKTLNTIKIIGNNIEGEISDIIIINDNYTTSKTIFDNVGVIGEYEKKPYTSSNTLDKLKSVVEENQKTSLKLALENNGVYKSSVAIKFLKDNNVDLSLIQKTVLDFEDINEILNDHFVCPQSSKKFMICIKDIVGFEYGNSRSSQLFENFCRYFSNNSIQYSTKANGMLEYSSYAMVEKIQTSFSQESMKVLSVENDKYIIDGNGYHRYILLTICYLNELEKCSSEEEIEELNQKFTIPTKMRQTDIFKSYCKYLLNIYNKNRIRGSINIKIDEDNPNLCMIPNYVSNFITDDELLEYVVLNIKENIFEYEEIKNYILKYPSFKEFMIKYNKKHDEILTGKKVL